MAKQGVVSTAADTVVGAAKTSAEGVRSLAGDAASSVAKAATGAVRSAVKRRATPRCGKPAKRKTTKRKDQAAHRWLPSSRSSETRSQDHAPQGGAKEVSARERASYQRQI